MLKAITVLASLSLQLFAGSLAVAASTPSPKMTVDVGGESAQAIFEKASFENGRLAGDETLHLEIRGRQGVRCTKSVLTQTRLTGYSCMVEGKITSDSRVDGIRRQTLQIGEITCDKATLPNGIVGDVSCTVTSTAQPAK